MLHVFQKNWHRTKYLALSGFAIIFLLLLTVVYQSDEKITKNPKISENSNGAKEITIFKKFLLNQIKSPYINLDYEIKKGDTIGKILKKYKVQNSDIQSVINEYKKYGKSSQLLIGNQIDIIIKEDAITKKNSIIKFSVPITKSTTISITKNEDNKIVSDKIITKLYKRRILSGNIIKNNAINAVLL